MNAENHDELSKMSHKERINSAFAGFTLIPALLHKGLDKNLTEHLSVAC